MKNEEEQPLVSSSKMVSTPSNEMQELNEDTLKMS